MPKGKPKNGRSKETQMVSHLSSVLADYMHRLPVDERLKRLANFNQVVARAPRGTKGKHGGEDL